MNYLHERFASYEEGLEKFKKWRRGFFPHDWDKEAEEHAEAEFEELWNRANFDGNIIY